MAVVVQDVVFRQRIREPVDLGEARKGAQILGIGPQRVMADAAFIAAGIDEIFVIERGHVGLLLRCPANASRSSVSLKLGLLQPVTIMGPPYR